MSQQFVIPTYAQKVIAREYCGGDFSNFSDPFEPADLLECADSLFVLLMTEAGDEPDGTRVSTESALNRISYIRDEASQVLAKLQRNL